MQNHLQFELRSYRYRTECSPTQSLSHPGLDFKRNTDTINTRPEFTQIPQILFKQPRRLQHAQLKSYCLRV
jgi:hypothetical protein